jgi:hypothetical protein
MKTSTMEEEESNIEKESWLWSVSFLKSDYALVVLLYNPVGFEERGDLGLIWSMGSVGTLIIIIALSVFLFFFTGKSSRLGYNKV